PLQPRRHASQEPSAPSLHDALPICSTVATASCLTPVGNCGNGVVDPGEQCDDGNTVSGDGCSASCRLEACGNGILDPGEQCDDGDRKSTRLNSSHQIISYAVFCLKK